MPTLYRNFSTVEDIDSQYDVERNPRIAEYIASFTERSGAARDTLRRDLDVPYGPTSEETFDVFHGQGRGPHPVLFFVHGGWWRATTSKLWSYVATGLASRGITTVIENYALCPTVSVSEIVRQHRAAFSTMWRRAADLDIDRERIVIAGHSAGGHAVAALLSTDWEADYRIPTHNVAGAIPISSAFDLRFVPDSWLAPYLRITPSDALAISQLEAPPWAPPTVVAVGGRESEEFHRQSSAWVTACAAAGLPVELCPVPDRDHFDVLEELASPDGMLAQAALRFLDI